MARNGLKLFVILSKGVAVKKSSVAILQQGAQKCDPF